MSNSSPRVRFAPSPTGLMHIGNIRIALMNYLFAQQKNGTFILRIEDTDPERIYDVGAEKILGDLAWLGLKHTEGPLVGGPHAPYFQSERDPIHKEKLQALIDMNKVYRCFCTTEELDKRRERQIALKQPPRYDRACINLSDDAISAKLNDNTPFIWRVKLDHDQTITITDIVHGTINFDMKNFSDFPLTRQNGTFTFMFANFVDDMVMEMTHVIRGEDHLTNTAGQAALYLAFDKELPIYWHMPIICNVDGKKLSKRDFGFSLNDLRNAGYLPEAICNYLAIIGASYEQEIMSMDELVTNVNLDSRHGSSAIKYDVEKLRWVNHKWVERLPADQLTELCMPFLQKAYPAIDSLGTEKITQLIQTIKSDVVVLTDVVDALAFYFAAPQPTADDFACISADALPKVKAIVQKHIYESDADTFVVNIKAGVQEQNIKLKELFWFVRLCLIGAKQGPSIADIVTMLGHTETKKRLTHFL